MSLRDHRILLNISISFYLNIIFQIFYQLINPRNILRNTGKIEHNTISTTTQALSLQNSKYIIDFYFYIIHLQKFLCNNLPHSNKSFLHDFSYQRQCSFSHLNKILNYYINISSKILHKCPIRKWNIASILKYGRLLIYVTFKHVLV